MDSPPALETVYQAVYSLYNNSNPSDSGKASLWLGELQKSVFAWKISDEMLQQKRDIESCYFAAQTMRTKIQLSFHELPLEAHTSLRDSLMEHISQINEHTNSAIVTQLCLALAALALQMSSWQKPVIDLINRFGRTSSSLWPLLEIMTVLPEEVKSKSLRLGANRRQHVLVELISTADTVTEFLKMCLKDGGDNVQIRVTILRCFTSWITVRAIPLQTIPTSEVVTYVFQVLGNHMAGSQLHEAAADCMCVILQALEEDSNSSRDNNSEPSAQFQQLQMCLFSNVMELEQPYHLSVVHEDMEKSINYCRVFTELAETFIDTIIEGSADRKDHYAIKILDLVLICLGHHDYEVAQITFHLWYRLSEVLYQKNDDELNLVFRPHIERLIGALCRHCQMEPDHLGLVEEGGGGEEFAEFRNRVSELIKDVIFVVGSSHCFRQMFSSLTGGPGPQGLPSVQTPTWDSIEAALFVMQAVAKNILPEENDVVPKVVEAILNLPENTHIAVQYTSILLLGELCEWIDSHPQTLEPILNTLLACLSKKGLGTAASGALLSICTACSERMGPHFPGLLQIARSLDSFGISNDSAIGLLKGTALVLARLPGTEITPAMKELCWFQAIPLCEILQNKVTIEKGTKTDPVIWLDRLAVIFRYTNPLIPDSNAPHPCQNVVTEMWPVLSNVCTEYQHDARLMERCCRCLRFAVRCVGKYSAHLLEPLVKQIVQLYSAHQHSCFLYLGSILVDEYASETDCLPGLLSMLEAFIGPTFTILQQDDGLKDHPDTIDDLFRLCARFLQRVPIPFLHSSIISSVIDCALMACSLDHRDANASVMKFFYDLLYSGRMLQSHPDYSIRQQLVRGIILEKGQTLVMRLLHASVFSLSSYMLSDVADVLVELNLADRQLSSKWLEEAIKSMPTQNADGSPTATNEQLVEFHNTVTRADTAKPVTVALRYFARLYR